MQTTEDESKPALQKSQPNDAVHDSIITELKQEIADLKMELSNRSAAKETDETIEIPQQMNSTELEQTNVKIDVIQQRFVEFETMYLQSQQEFIVNFRNLDERQKTYINDIEVTIKDIIERSLSSVSRSNLALDAVNDSNLPEIKEPELNEEHRSTEGPVQVDAIGTASSEYSLTDYSVNENEDEIVYPIPASNDQVQKPVVPIPHKRRQRINRSVAVQELHRRLTELGVSSDVVGVSARKVIDVSKELSADREVVKRIYKSFPAIRQKLHNEVDRLAKSKLNPTESYSSLSSIDDNRTTTRKRPKSAKHRTVHDSILKKLISNDIDENNLKDKMMLAQSALDAHRECIQELLKTTAHAPTPMNLTRGNRTDASDDELDVQDKGNVDEIGQNSSNRYNKMPNVTTRRVVFVNLDEDS